jgi:hypothetical protein
MPTKVHRKFNRAFMKVPYLIKKETLKLYGDI